VRAFNLSVASATSTIQQSAEIERFLVIDTETTGLGADHRVVEIGVVEIVNRRVTGREFHVYVNPERSMDAEAESVHGLTSRFLADKPKFHEIADEFIEFLGENAQLVAHHATFDINKINAEFKRLGSSFMLDETFQIVDTMKLSRKMFPGQRATMDALCDRLNVSRQERQVSGLHGALVDARILARVFLQMTAGQVQLGYSEGRQAIAAAGSKLDRTKFPSLRIVYATTEEESSHARLCDLIEKASGGYCGFRGKWTTPEKETVKMEVAPNTAEFGSGTVAASSARKAKPSLAQLVMTANVSQTAAGSMPAPAAVMQAIETPSVRASVLSVPPSVIDAAFSPSI
jgi:DNA polymerase-3 subunit epsilon